MNATDVKSLYRLKIEIWEPIANELCVPQQSAEAMHWTLGKDNMAFRAQGIPIEPKPCQSSASMRLIDNQVLAKPKSKEESQQPVTLEDFENRRTHRFNASKPPQLSAADLARQARSDAPFSQAFSTAKVHKPFSPFTNPPPLTIGASIATICSVRQRKPGILPKEDWSAPVGIKNTSEPAEGIFGQTLLNIAGSSVPSLTIEGKRQAQAAGDKLRARTSPSRHRRGVMTANNLASHQNRWADYNTPNSVFPPKASTVLPKDFGGPSLTSEGKRQAQVAGDSTSFRSHDPLLCKLSEAARHVPGFFSGGLALRRVSLILIHLQMAMLTVKRRTELRLRTNPIRHSKPSRGSVSDHGINKNRWSSYGGARVTRFDERNDAQNESKVQPQFEATEKSEQSKQPSHLEVFETELAKKILDGNSQKIDVKDLVTEKHINYPEIRPVTPSPATESVVTASQSKTLPQHLNPLMDGLKMINEHLQGLAAPNEGPSQELSNAIGNSVRTAFGGFNSFLQSISGGIHEASHMTRQAADRTREIDGGLLGDAAVQLLNVENGVAALAKKVESIGQEMNETKESHVIPVAKTASEPVTVSCEVDSTSDDLGENGSILGSMPTASSPASKRPITTRKFEVPMDSDDEERDSLTLTSRIQATRKVTVPPESGAIGSGPGYRAPSIVARQAALPCSRVAPPYPNSHLSDTGNTVYAEKPATLPPVATRFPTLAQFEGQSFTPSFPPLPSMKALVPQRADLPSVLKAPEAQSQSPQSVTGLTQDQQTKSKSATTATELLMMNGIDTGNLSDSQFTLFQQQNLHVQQKSIQVYAQNLAKSQRHQHFMSREGICSPNHHGLSTNERPVPHLAATQTRDAPTPNSNVGLDARQDYETQLMLLEQQSKKRLSLARLEQEMVATESEDAATLARHVVSPMRIKKQGRDPATTATKVPAHPYRHDQRSVADPSQQSKEQGLEVPQEKDAANSKSSAASEHLRTYWSSPSQITSEKHKSRETDGDDRGHVGVQDYQMQLMLLEKQRMARREKDTAASHAREIEIAGAPQLHVATPAQAAASLQSHSTLGPQVVQQNHQILQPRLMAQQQGQHVQQQSNDTLKGNKPASFGTGNRATQDLGIALPPHLQQQQTQIAQEQHIRMQQERAQRQQALQAAAHFSHSEQHAAQQQQSGTTPQQMAQLQRQKLLQHQARQQQASRQGQQQHVTQQAQTQAQRQITAKAILQQKTQQRDQLPALHTLIKPKDFASLTHMSNESKEKYTNGVATLYEILDCCPQDSQNHHEAYQELVKVSTKVRQSIQQKRSETVTSLRLQTLQDNHAKHAKDSVPQIKQASMGGHPGNSDGSGIDWSGKADSAVDWSNSEESEEEDSEENQEEQEDFATNKSAAAQFIEDEMVSERRFNCENDRREPLQASKNNKKATASFPSAARLVEPFDPLDGINSAQPHPNEGIRRNATVAGTDSRYNVRRRRPYSEAFDGNGRVAWDSFLQDNRRGPRNIPIRGPSDKAAKHNVSTIRTNQFNRPSLNEEDRRVADCTRQLKDLGFLKNELGAEERLVMFAQAANGDLVEAIDMIDEEERAYSQRF